MTTTKKILTVAIAAVALTTASLASTGSANALSRGGGGHHHFFHRGVFFAPVVYNSCWKVIVVRGILKRVYVCGY
jgi:hypothetical protein